MIKIEKWSDDKLGRQTWGFRVEEIGEEICVILREYVTESRKSTRHKFVMLGYYGFLPITNNARRIQLENIPLDADIRNDARNVAMAKITVVRKRDGDV